MDQDARRPMRGLSRRTIAGGIAALAAAPMSAARERPMTQNSGLIAYTGCRTSRERNARGEGIGVYAVDPAGGAWRRIQLVGELLNPSYLAFDRHNRFLFAAHGDSLEVSAFKIAPDGQLAFINKAPTGGRNPVHLVADPTNRFLLVANHVVSGELKSGIASLPIHEDGSLGAPTDVVALDGKTGPHRVEQPFPKPHQVAYDPQNRFIVVPDKGCDRVLVFQLDDHGAFRALPQAGAKARENAGPRHVAFHPGGRLAYVLNELDSTIGAHRVDPDTGALQPFQIVSSLPDDFTGDSRASEIEVSRDGRFVYASNRGSDTIGTFAIDPASGRLTAVGWTASGGKTPRFFTLAPDGHSLFAANEDSDTIVRMAVDATSGRLSAPEVVAQTGSPTCILFSNPSRR